MLKKCTSNIVLSLINNKENNEKTQSKIKQKKIKNFIIKTKNSEEKDNSQIKNTVLNKIIVKSNSITQNNNNEHYLLNYKNKMSIKNSPIISKNNNKVLKDQSHFKSKIKTTFSNYYTDFASKNNKSNFNLTEINSPGDDTGEISHIQLNNDTHEDTLPTNKIKYLGLYNTDSSQKINFNTCINNSHVSNKDYSLLNKDSILISQNNGKNNENKKMSENSNKKIQKLKPQNSETKKKITSNKNLKHFETNIYKKSKNVIKSKKMNANSNRIDVKKSKNGKNKLNTKIILDNNNKNSIKKNNSGNKISHDQHIFLSPIQKKINNIVVKMKSSSKKLNKINNNYLSHYNTTNSTLNKETKKIIFQIKDNYKKQNSNNSSVLEQKKKQNISHILNKLNKNNNQTKNKFIKISLNTNINVFSYKDELEINNLETDIYKLMNEHKEMSPSIISENKTIEKDLGLESNNSIIQKDKNLNDYFRAARNALKSMSHSLADASNSNNYKTHKNDILFNNKAKIKKNKMEQKSIREKDDDSNNCTIKKVPVFVGINIFPNQNNKHVNNSLFINMFFNQTRNDVKKCILSFLNDKTIMCLSVINKQFFKNIRNIFYTNIYNKICKNKNNNFIKKINDSLLYSKSNELKINKSKLESIYDSCSTQTSYIDIILNDLSRTFPNDVKFQKNSIYYNKLYNILTKYSNYNTIIGYAQGLNFLFANGLYLFDDEKNAFFYIDGLIKRFGLENYLAEKNPQLSIEINKFSKLLYKYIPDIVNYFDEKLVNHEFFSTDWILTLFSNSMKSNNLFICWNFMIIFGWKFFYCFVIQILVYYKSLIFKTDENGLSQLMKNLLKTQNFNHDLLEIINKALTFMQENIIL